jgi:hypothetical protein
MIVEGASEFAGFLSGFDIERRKRKLGSSWRKWKIKYKFLMSLGQGRPTQDCNSNCDSERVVDL